MTPSLFRNWSGFPKVAAPNPPSPTPPAHPPLMDDSSSYPKAAPPPPVGLLTSPQLVLLPNVMASQLYIDPEAPVSYTRAIMCCIAALHSLAWHSLVS